eukprot:c12166_g1_i1.p1 GENE.c12166_g1_i1~~c12166_g1_i1.p1  ORF type:complete len:134 (-),score=23.06 c12166_g1_i1:118-519(-)
MGTPKHAQMFDFCLSIPYGLIVIVGGLLGGLKGSLASAVMGSASGGIVLWLGIQSYQEYQKNSNLLSSRYSKQSLVVSALLSVIMGIRYSSSGKFMPAGLVFGLSAFMSAFFVWEITKFIPGHNLKNNKKRGG